MDREVSPLIIQKTSSQWTTQDPFLAKGDIGAESDTGREKFGVGLKWSDTPYRPGDPIFKLKLADQSLASSTTLTDDDTLFFTAEANSTYVVSLNLIVYGVIDTVQINGKMVGPSGATFYGNWLYVYTSGTPGGDGILAAGDVVSNDYGLSDSPSQVTLPQSFVVKTDATAGTVKFQFRQGTSSGSAVKVYGGSFLRAEKVA